MTTQTENDHIGRLDRLEAIVEQLADTVQEDRRVNREFHREVREIIGRHGRTSWPLVVSVVFGVATAGIASTGLALTIGAMALQPVRQNIGDLAVELNRHEDIDGHSEMLQKHAEYAPKFETIENRLTRNESDIQHLDTEIDGISQDRFYGHEGRALIERITRLETLHERDGGAP